MSESQGTVFARAACWRRGVIVPVAATLFLASWGTLAAGASPSPGTFTPATAGPVAHASTAGQLARGTDGAGHIKIVEPNHDANPSVTKASVNNALALAASGSGLPLWQQSENYPAGNPYTYTMVGGSPFTAGAGTTTVTSPVIPIKIVLQGSGTLSDASTTASDCSQTLSAAGLTQISPLFQNTVPDPEGTQTQYVDALQRGNFNQQTQPSGISPKYHLLFSPTSPGTVTMTVPAADALQAPGVKCGTLTGINYTWFWGNLQVIITNLVDNNVISPTQLPLFVLYNTVLCADANCTSGADGYHDVESTIFGPQVYAVADYDLTGDLTATDSMSESHEFAEAVNDPLTVTPAPTWGYVGQDQAGCQQNLESGDPLSPGFPGSPASVADTYSVSNVSHTFHFQDEAYHSWFFRETTATSKNVATTLGTGAYSMFGAFSGGSNSTVCPGQASAVTAVPGNGQATVSWTAGPGPVDFYIVIPYSGGAPDVPGPQMFNSRATTQTVTGLSNKTTYTFTVLAGHVNNNSASCPYDGFTEIAANHADCSTESLPSNPVTVGAPTAPTGISATGISGGASVSWTAPASNNGSPITGYVITPFLNGVAETPDSFNSTATKENVTGLTKGQNYTFKVAAINGNGTGVNSVMSNLVAPK